MLPLSAFLWISFILTAAATPIDTRFSDDEIAFVKRDDAEGLPGQPADDVMVLSSSPTSSPAASPTPANDESAETEDAGGMDDSGGLVSIQSIPESAEPAGSDDSTGSTQSNRSSNSSSTANSTESSGSSEPSTPPESALSLRSTAHDAPSSLGQTIYASPIERQALLDLLKAAQDDLSSNHRSGTAVFYQYDGTHWSFQVLITTGNGLSYNLISDITRRFQTLTPPSGNMTWSRVGTVNNGNDAVADIFIVPIVSNNQDFQSASSNFQPNVINSTSVLTQTSLPSGYETASLEYNPQTLNYYSNDASTTKHRTRKRQASSPSDITREVRRTIPGTPYTLTVSNFVDSSNRLRLAYAWQYRYAVAQALNLQLAQNDRFHQGNSGNNNNNNGSVLSNSIDSGTVTNMQSGARFKMQLLAKDGSGNTIQFPTDTWATIAQSVIEPSAKRPVNETLYAVHGKLRGPDPVSGGGEVDLGEWYLNTGAM
ncbi:MAG: hypothetical protein Q9190_002466 [Brigantiaea leucoxantha]